MRIVKRYFFVQQLAFAAIGIDPMAMVHENQRRLTHPHRIIKHPAALAIPLCLTILHCLAICHYVYVNANDYSEVTDSLTLMCQALIAIWKMIIFVLKRKEIVQLVKRIYMENTKAKWDELPLIRHENAKDVLFSTTYFTTVLTTGIWSLLTPILSAVYVYVSRGEIVLRVPHKATYFWNHQHVQGYTFVCICNMFTVYYILFASVAIDGLFSWLVCNIIAQYRILLHRFEMASKATATRAVTTAISVDGNADEEAPTDDNPKVQAIIACIKFHSRPLQLTHELNRVYGAIIFIKFIISGTQICCLAFSMSRGNQSVSILAYLIMFLSSVAIQLILYCYNGQRIKDVSLQVASQIYAVFQWSHLAKSTQKLLLMPMMRSQKVSQLRGVFFTVDLSLYLWVFKTAGSLIAVLKKMDENQD